MKLPEYTGQKTGIYYLPTGVGTYNSDRWLNLLGDDYFEKYFHLDFKLEQSGTNLLDIFWWCEEHCKGVVFLFMEAKITIGFHKKSDAAHFKLKWFNG